MICSSSFSFLVEAITLVLFDYSDDFTIEAQFIEKVNHTADVLAKRLNLDVLSC